MDRAVPLQEVARRQEISLSYLEQLFAKLRRGPFAFLLESAPAGGETWSRYTFIGTEPQAAWRLTASGPAL